LKFVPERRYVTPRITELGEDSVVSSAVGGHRRPYYTELAT